MDKRSILETQSHIAATQAVTQLLQVSGSKDLKELLEFAYTLSVAPGSVGNTSYEVLSAMEQIEQDTVPQALLWWYLLVRTDA